MTKDSVLQLYYDQSTLEAIRDIVFKDDNINKAQEVFHALSRKELENSNTPPNTWRKLALGFYDWMAEIANELEESSKRTSQRDDESEFESIYESELNSKYEL